MKFYSTDIRMLEHLIKNKGKCGLLCHNFEYGELVESTCPLRLRNLCYVGDGYNKRLQMAENEMAKLKLKFIEELT